MSIDPPLKSVFVETQKGKDTNIFLQYELASLFRNLKWKLSHSDKLVQLST